MKLLSFVCHICCSTFCFFVEFLVTTFFVYPKGEPAAGKGGGDARHGVRRLVVRLGERLRRILLQELQGYQEPGQGITGVQEGGENNCHCLCVVALLVLTMLCVCCSFTDVTLSEQNSSLPVDLRRPAFCPAMQGCIYPC